MRLIFAVLTVVMMVTLIAPVAAQEGGAASGRYWQSRGGISATGGGMVTSDQGRYRQRGSAGEAVASSGLSAGQQTSGSLGFWWRVTTEDTTGDGPVRVYLPVIIKAGGQ